MRKKIKIVIFMIIVLIIIAVGVVVVSKLEEVSVKGNTYYTDDKIKKELTKYYVGGNTILTYLRIKYGEEIRIPFVDEIEVDLEGFHNLTVGIIEKEVVGCLPYMGEYICFDKDGIMVGSITEKRENVPIVKGIEYDVAVFNKPISTKTDEVFELTLNLTQLIKKYNLAVDKIEFEKNMAVRLYYKDIKIILGKKKHFDTEISNLAELLPKTEGMKGTLHMEDFSETRQRVIFETDKL